MSTTKGSLKKASFRVVLLATAARFLFASNTVVPFPEPLIDGAPLGSLIYNGSVTGTIQNAGDTVSFTLPVDANQTITVDVSPAGSLQPTIAITDPAANVIGVATASNVGLEAVLQTVPASITGIYTLTLSGNNNTTGNFTVQVTLNAALDFAAHGGSENATLATAQDLTSSAISLTAGADRLAVVGHFEGTDDFYSFALQTGQSSTLALTLKSNAAVSLQLLDSSGNVLATGGSGASNVSQSISNFVASAIGTYYARVAGTGQSDYSLVVTRGATFDLEPNDNAAEAQGTTENPVLGAIGNGTAVPDADWYQFQANAGDTIAVTTTTPSDQGQEFHNGLFPQIDLYDSSVKHVASNAGGPKNAPVIWKALAAGTFFAKVSGAKNSTGEYVLVESATQLPSLSGKIASKTGPHNARVWNISISNGGPASAVNTQITGATLAETFGAACTPVIQNAFPLNLGTIAAGAAATGNIVIDFTGCASNARFTVKIPFSATDAASSIVRYNEFQ